MFARTCKMYEHEYIGRGEETRMIPAAGMKLNESPASNAVSVQLLPCWAIYERDEIQQAWDLLRKPDT